MNARTARAIRAGIRQARSVHRFIYLFAGPASRVEPLTVINRHEPRNHVAAAAYARTLTRLTRRTTP